ncbi:hypothetical protein NE237_003506 [Protea cynaroides]|uniref:Uncharacterized protein n=1 Tax=Protea cynaroides TaxID=273540 RepID=A0A9Q0QSP1_9MAGN|nr:hypothetical protein NE237_003506 [Protea cynaroides]
MVLLQGGRSFAAVVAGLLDLSKLPEPITKGDPQQIDKDDQAHVFQNSGWWTDAMDEGDSEHEEGEVLHHIAEKQIQHPPSVASASSGVMTDIVPSSGMVKSAEHLQRKVGVSLNTEIEEENSEAVALEFAEEGKGRKRFPHKAANEGHVYISSIACEEFFPSSVPKFKNDPSPLEDKEDDEVLEVTE